MTRKFRKITRTEIAAHPLTGRRCLVGLLIWLYGSARYDAGRLAERVVWEARSARATLDDFAAKARLDAARAVATQENSDDLKAQLADALARAARRPAELRDAAARDRGQPAVSGAAEPASAADRAGQAAVMAADDAACAENTVKAKGWQNWWRAVSATDG